MLQKITSRTFINRGAITILYPGITVSKADTGIGSIGRIDHAYMSGSHTIPMHPHVNDEILSYFRTGKGEHKDSEGYIEIIGRNKLMLMKAGRSFSHEEKMIDEGEPLEGLQIFIRPGIKDLQPKVVFFDLKELHSENKWRLLASPTDETVLQFSSQTWIYDMKLLAGMESQLPKLPDSGLTCLLYIFKGDILVNSDINLIKKESLFIKDENITIKANNDSELVLFVTNEHAEIFDGGMYSGNQA